MIDGEFLFKTGVVAVRARGRSNDMHCCWQDQNILSKFATIIFTHNSLNFGTGAKFHSGSSAMIRRWAIIFSFGVMPANDGKSGIVALGPRPPIPSPVPGAAEPGEDSKRPAGGAESIGVALDAIVSGRSGGVVREGSEGGVAWAAVFGSDILGG